MPTRHARVTRIVVNGRKLFIYTPYDADFVSELKASIPHGARKWEPEARCWEADAKYLDTIRAIIRNVYGAEPKVQRGPAGDASGGPRNAEDAAREDARRRQEQENRQRRQQQERDRERIRDDFRRRFGFGFDEDTDDPWGFSGRSNGRSGASGGRGGASTPPASTGLTWADRMFMELPAEVHRGVYLALVKALHPDRVGDTGTEIMKSVNKAHDVHGKDK